jgi:hypothetical protein
MLYVRRIPERPGAGRLGRHVRHDPRSLAYLYPAHEVAGLVSVRHQRAIPVLDQGDLGSCTGNAAEGAIGTGALFEALANTTLQPSATDADGDEHQAIALYSEATQLDDYSGSYPPEDTGSDGLSVAKAAQAAGLISGYTHCTDLDSALKALSQQPVICGVNWYSSFDSPAADGTITIGRKATVRGGHEFVLDELDVERKRIGFTNSWGESWGADGRAYISWADFERLLSEDGDVTVFTPANAPAPTPTPPTPAPADPLSELVELLKQFIDSIGSWLKSHGF